MKLNTILLAGWLVTLIALLIVLAVPISQAFEPKDWSIQGGHYQPWTVERGIEYLEWARDCHVYYTNHPSECNDRYTGDAEFNRKLVSEYQQIINWLEGMKNEI